MMEHTVDMYENDSQMAIRLMKTLHHREEVFSQKKRYMLETWPEDTKKHKKPEFLTARCVSELDLRGDKDIASVRTIVEDSVTLLYGHYKEGSMKSPDISLSTILDLPDLDLLKMSPMLFSSLNLRSLKAILAAVTGNRLASTHRSLVERELKKELAKSILASTMHSDRLLIVTTILRSPNSYCHAYQFTNLDIKPFSRMPPSIFAAALETFKHIDKFPSSVIVEVYKLLPIYKRRVSKLPTQQLCQSVILKRVHRNLKGLLGSMEEGDPLPSCVEKALQLISLSARILYGDDGNLKEQLSPLSPKQCSLEKTYESAFLRLKHLGKEDLSRIHGMIGPEETQKTKSRYIYEIQIWLIASVHCIYDGIDIPDNISKALSMINDGWKPENMEEKKTDTVKESRMKERLRAELDAILDVSAEFRNLIWESYEVFQEHNMESRLPCMNVDHTNCEKSNRDGQSPLLLDSTRVHVNTEEMEIEENIVMQKEMDCDINQFSDEIAKAVYIMIGCLLQKVSQHSSVALNIEELGYLQTGFQATSLQSCYGFSESLSQERIVLDIAKSLDIIPQSVLQEVEIRLNTIVEGDTK